ncbi:MAG: anaerobic ribonucleoside-triphosphate reductase activating protein [Nanoarchaeota archaeon]
MKIGGLQKQSLNDYPGKVAATIFLAGCNLRCGYCHNYASLVKGNRQITEESVLAYLLENKELLDGVCVSGGEPTLHRDLPALLARIKEMGLAVKLDTNGTNPTMLGSLLQAGLVDYVAMDVKAPLNYREYNFVCGNALTEELFNNIKSSIQILMHSDVAHEFRTTLVNGAHSTLSARNIAMDISGARRYVVQTFRPEHAHDSAFQKMTPFSQEDMNRFVQDAKAHVNDVTHT